MKYFLFSILFLSAFLTNATTFDKNSDNEINKSGSINLLNDSIFINLKEVLIYRSLRDNEFAGNAPVSSTSLAGNKLESQNAENLRSISTYVPNLFIPDYGSRITSAVYLRGIGSRISTSAVGFYVDNIPYLDKSAFDFELQDLQRVDILRGPQGTLYGRNSSGGLIHVHTKSPFNNLGSSVRLSYGNFDQLKVQAKHGMLINPDLALSISGNFNKGDGYVDNEFTGESSGKWQSAGLRAKISSIMNNGWKSELNVSYDYSDQNGYPYAPFSEGEMVVSYNDPSTYKRDILTAGLLIEKESKNTVFSSMTGYQLLSDDLSLDQDFSPASLFTLKQKQRQHSVTQEVVFKSRGERTWEWVNGAIGFFKKLHTSSPVRFKSDGIGMLESNINRNIPSTLNLNIDITDQELVIPSLFTENNQMTAFYHQSTYNFNKIEGLSVTAGLRMDYDQVYLDYNSSAWMKYSYTMARGPMSISDDLRAFALLDNKKYSDFWQFVPKFSIQYEIDDKNRFYGSVTKGFQSGGYNIQLFSDLIQMELQAVMSEQMKASMTDKLQQYVSMGMPQSSVDVITAKIPVSERIKDIEPIISYDPEYSWNYELGFHTEPIENKLQIDGAIFYIDVKNRQIAVFSPNGFGRMMDNAASSVSKGIELSVIAKPFKNMNFNASYGLTEAKFSSYTDSVMVEGSYQEVDYSNKYVPLVPKHTLSVGADYSLNINSKLLDKIVFAAQYSAAGPIYWTVNNDLRQNFYGLTDAQLSFIRDGIRFDLWVKNAFNEKYNTFYFESMGNSFAQKGRPMQFGISTKVCF